MKSNQDVRWVLAFDASCGRCRAISKAVDETAQGRLEVLPLTHHDVQAWREKALGADAPFAPTLIRVRGERVSAWTGTAMGVRLAGRLRIRSTARLLRALGEVRLGAGRTVAQSETRLLGRRRLFKLGAGVGVAAGLVLAGKAPAFAESEELTAARAWARANQVPRTGLYDRLGTYSMEARRAAFVEFSPSVRSQLWTEHLARYRRDHQGLSARQLEVLDEAESIAADLVVFDTSAFDGGPEAERVRKIEQAAVDAFGCQEYLNVLVDLGPSGGSEVRPQQDAMFFCYCHVGSACEACISYGCTRTGGCGCFDLWTCNGIY